MFVQELGVKLSKITKQLEALQAALNASGARGPNDQSASCSSSNGQHDDNDKEVETEAERVQRFGKSE